MSATIFIEPESVVKSELSQLGRQRSTRQILSNNHYDDAPQQKGAVHLLLLPEEAGDRPYQHGLVSVGSESAADDDDEYCDLELVGVDGISWVCPLVVMPN